MPGWLVKWWMATRRYRHNATMDWLCRCQTSHEQTQQFPQVLNHLHIFTYCLYVKKIQKSSNIIKNPQFKKQLNTSKLFPFALFSSPKDLNPGPCGILRLLRLHPAAMLGGKASQAAPNMKVAVRQPKKKDSADVIWKWWYYGWLIMVNLWLIPSP